ncbi:MAG: sulfatase-like hydrolase/transferase [Holosporaceae bacterium]|nr:sulfatase-like hydrolase/transferase [Holosporaceae bacterium]
MLSFFSIIQIIQFCHIKYFGILISTSSLYLLEKEILDVSYEVMDLFISYFPILLTCVLSFVLIYKIYPTYPKENIKSTLGSILLIASSILYVSIIDGQLDFTPNPTRFAFENSIKTVCGYIYSKVGKIHKFNNYKAYSVERIKPISNDPVTIVYILGESSNSEHMSLFGYDEDTTPNLRKMFQSGNVYCTVGIAGAVSTISSCKFMCNAIREPDNIRQTSSDTTNLFRLAKESGFKTFYISAQQNNLCSSVGGTPYIDVLITRMRYPKEFSYQRDTFLLDIIDKQEFTDKNFVVIHQRCIHSPYRKTVPNSFCTPSRQIKHRDTLLYNNAMVYNDYVISSLFGKFNKSKNKFYIFWTSDHNELTGQNGLYGHGHLLLACARIPIIIQSNDQDFLCEIRKKHCLTHYDICSTIIGLFGMRIINPNEEKEIYYINGIDYDGKCGYIKIKIPQNGDVTVRETISK